MKTQTAIKEIIKITAKVNFKDQSVQTYQIDGNRSSNDRFISLWYGDKEYLYNIDCIECIEILKTEVKK